MVAWLAATLAGSVDPESALSALQYDSDGQVAVGWPDRPLEELELADVFTGLLSTRVRTVALALPVAGDPLGLTSTGAFAQAALDAESAVVIGTDGPQLGLIPTRDLRGSSYRGWRWQVFIEPAVAPTAEPTAFVPVGTLPPAHPLHVIEQTDRALSRALRDATADLAALDLAQWRPEVAAGRKEAEAALRAAGQRMPPGWPAPARALAERALMLWRIVRVARADAGASSASGSHARAVALSRLSHAVRSAAMVAYNVPVVALPIAPTDTIIDLVQRPLA
jgi:hypothetical protein